MVRGSSIRTANKPRTSQVFYHYSELEEHRHGMWRTVAPAEQDHYVDAAAVLMGEPDVFFEAMMRALDEWPKSIEAAFTTPSLNRQAFIGYAGCCIAVDSPEYLTRLGWHQLTEEQQGAANAAADRVIAEWERRRAGRERGLWDA